MNKIAALLALAVVFHTLPAHADAPPALSKSTEKPDFPPVSPLPKGSAASYLSGQFARAKGDIAVAIRYLRRAHQQNPGNAEMANQLQSLLLLDGEIAEAIQLIKKNDTAHTALSSLLLTMEAVKNGKLDEAASVLAATQDVGAGQLWHPLFTAWIEAARGKLTQPVQFEDMNAEATAGSALANYHLALINSHAGFTEAATENFRRSIIDPENPPARVMHMLTRFYNRNGSPHALAPLVDAAARLKNDDTQAMAEDVGAQFTLRDGIAEVLFTMGSVMQGAGAEQDAILYLHLAHYLKPDFPVATLGIADAYTAIKQYEKANQYYERIGKESRLYLRSRLRMAINENHKGELSSALERLENLSQSNPGSYEPLVAKADLLRARQWFKEASEAYTAALARIQMLQPAHWAIFFARAVSFDRQDKWLLAEQDLEKALALKPNQPDVLNYLGYGLLVRRERTEEAQEMIEKALALKPADPQIADSMGWAMYSLGKYEEALVYLERALDLMPTDPTINDHLGDVYWQLGRRMEARFQWERSLDFAPSPDDAVTIRRKLQEGLALELAPEHPPASVADTSVHAAPVQ